ncbi:MAG: hypothetical protein ACI9H8_001107 [Lysobacterales bacterium]|jgi:hypothetical protein
MKFLRIPALVAITALAVTACNRDTGGVSQTSSNPLLSHVPADTPYVFANIEPTPADVIDSFMLRLAPSLLTAQTLLNDFKIEINSDDDEHQEARLLSAILAEFDGKLNREGLDKLGLSMESHKVIYGMGVFPVVRIALRDPAALRAAIGRVEASSGMDFGGNKLGETEYWKIAGHGKGQGAVYIAILEDHAAFSMFPTAAEAEWLPALLGQSMPAESIASNNALDRLNKDKGYSNYGSGFLDLQKLADEVLNPGSKTVTLVNSIGHYDPSEFGEVCLAEVKGIIAKAPRMVMGTTELSSNILGLSYQLELESSLAGKLLELVAEVPVADNNPDKLVSASLGIQFGKLRTFAMEQINAVIANPYQCEKLQQLNTQATVLAEQMNVPVMPFINNLKGFRLSLDEVDFEDFNPEKAKGMFSLEVEKPQMLIGMAQMFVPGMDGLELEAGADPVELPQEILSFSSNGMRIFAAMSKDAIGVASGEHGMEELSAFMEADSDNKNVFFSVDYDMSAQLELQRKLQAEYTPASYGHEGNDEIQELISNIQDSYIQWLGRSRTEISFNKDGLQIDSNMTFK